MCKATGVDSFQIRSDCTLAVRVRRRNSAALHGKRVLHHPLLTGVAQLMEPNCVCPSAISISLVASRTCAANSFCPSIAKAS